MRQKYARQTEEIWLEKKAPKSNRLAATWTVISQEQTQWHQSPVVKSTEVHDDDDDGNVDDGGDDCDDENSTKSDTE